MKGIENCDVAVVAGGINESHLHLKHQTSKEGYWRTRGRQM